MSLRNLCHRVRRRVLVRAAPQPRSPEPAADPGRGEVLLARWFGTAQLDHRAVGALLLPVIVSQAFIIGFIALNPMIVAPAGIAAVSAVSTVEYLNVFILSTFIALATAGSVLVAQRAGGRDQAGVLAAARSTLWAATLPALVVGAVLLAAHRPLLEALLGGAGPQVVEHGQVYFAGSVLSYPACAVVEACSAALRGIAKSRPALYLTVTMNGGFLLLATGLVHGAGLSVTGLAIAVVFSRYAAAGLALWLLRRHLGLRGRRLWSPQWATVRHIGLIGIPFVAEQAFLNGGKLVAQFFVVGMGTLQITANAVASSLVGLSEIVPQAMCVALVPIVGQAVGAGRPADARRVVRSFLWSATIVSVATAAVMLACFGWLLDLYQTPPEVAGDVLAVFLIATAGRLFGWWVLSYLLASGLRAAGDAAFTTAVGIATMALRVALIWLVGVRMGGLVVGVWAVMVGEWALRSVAFALRFRGSRWETRAFVPAAAAAVTTGSR